MREDEGFEGREDGSLSWWNVRGFRVVDGKEEEGFGRRRRRV